MHVIWTDEEREFIRANCAALTDQQIANELSAVSNRIVTTQAARKQRQNMGLKKMHGRGVCRLAAGIPTVRARAKPKGLSLHIQSNVDES